ncbi:DUF5610 domain-containing protein [Massilia sp. CFBP9026]|uniref:DUF5610 domain-containing protein n=1 Tax=Massilia sp. CFBP9026 TaxID=3096536 RepID=UPI002A69BA10|nr:DUF5610 domain-containing protein [Massilia sp. CFBP9026]MDY0964704.1 hypothetical protein [Massilia sp. CFBP9026]
MSLSISNVGPQGATLPAARVKPAVAEARQEAETPAQDKVTLGGRPAEPLTYGGKGGGKVTQSELASMIEESDRKAQQVMDLIRPLVEQQGLNFAKVVSGEQQLQADPETIEAAKAAIADGGEFSVEKTSERILGFAKAMIGADPSKMDTIRAAVEKGFQQAQDMLGGSLPEISQKTLAAVQAGFDQWQKDGFPAD